jgi:hypothetical protein
MPPFPTFAFGTPGCRIVFPDSVCGSEIRAADAKQAQARVGDHQAGALPALELSDVRLRPSPRGREEDGQSFQKRAGIERLTLPHQQDIPSKCFQLLLFAPVSLDVSRKFLRPKLRPRFGGGCAKTSPMPMPKTSMDEDGLS